MRTSINIKRRLEDYVAQKLLMKLDCYQKKFSLEETNLGIHNHVFYLNIEGELPLIVKVIPKKKRFQNLLNCHNHLLKHGVRVPKILFAEENGSFFKRFVMNIICEERIQGKTIQDMQSSFEMIAEVARFFSRMHRIKRKQWGEIVEGLKEGLFEYMLAKSSKKMKQWEKADCSLTTTMRKQVLQWLKSQEDKVKRATSYSLCHGDPNPGNIVFSNEGQLYLLDTGHITYLPRAVEFYTLEIHFCQDYQEKIRLFEKLYFEEMSSEDRDTFAASHLFFKMYVLVGFGCTLAKRLVPVALTQPQYQALSTNLNKIKQAISAIIQIG